MHISWLWYTRWDTDCGILRPERLFAANDIYFNEEKMHKRPIPTVEIRRVVFQEDGVVYNRDAGQQGQNAPIGQEEGVEPQAPKAQPVLRRSTRAHRAPKRSISRLCHADRLRGALLL